MFYKLVTFRYFVSDLIVLGMEMVVQFLDRLSENFLAVRQCIIWEYQPAELQGKYI